MSRELEYGKSHTNPPRDCVYFTKKSDIHSRITYPLIIADIKDGVKLYSREVKDLDKINEMINFLQLKRDELISRSMM